MLANISNYDQRIAGGKRLESKILDALRKKGHKIEPPTSNEDKYDKIDGWWIGTKGGRFPVQVKVREGGDDIIYEIVADMINNIRGRDLISKAAVYLIANTKGVTRMYLTKPIKEEAEKILQKVYDDLKENPYNTRWDGPGWEAKITYDRANGRKKLMAFFNPSKFQAIATWDIRIV